MNNASAWLANAMLNHFFRNTATTPPPQLFLALYTSNPTVNDVGAEIQGGSYVRRAVAFSAPVRDGLDTVISSAVEIRFPVATANWGNISHFAIRTAATGGNMLAFAAVPVPKPIETGDEAKFIVGSIRIRLAGSNITASGGSLTVD